jgi:hypothetical protein
LESIDWFYFIIKVNIKKNSFYLSI